MGVPQWTVGALGERHQRDPSFVSSFAAEAAAAPSAPIPAPAQPGSASPPQGATSPEEKASEAGGAHAIPRRHAPLEQLVRQGSFRGFPSLSQNSPFKRQLSLRLNELPSTLQRKGHSGSSAGEAGRGALGRLSGAEACSGDWHSRQGGEEGRSYWPERGQRGSLVQGRKGQKENRGGGNRSPQEPAALEAGLLPPSLPFFCQS